MHTRVVSKLNRKFTSDFAQLKKAEGEERILKRAALINLKKSIAKLNKDEKEGLHIATIKRHTADGDDLHGKIMLSSQEVMERIIEENELLGFDDDK